MIWIIGSKGMLGTELGGLLVQAGIPFVASDLDCDITDMAALRGFSTGKGIRWIINCSAYTAVDKAEDNEARARLINATGAGNIATVAGEIGAKMIHISTDYVFDGTASRPYVETDPVCPAGAYGRTKAEGEALVRQHCLQSFILRTAWLYGRHGNNFVFTMLRLMKEKPELGIVADQRGTPTWTVTLCQVILELVRRDADGYGVWQVTDRGETTWHEFAGEIQRLGVAKGLLPAAIPLRPLSTGQYPTKARRPAYSVLSKVKIEQWLGRPLPPWQESLAAFIGQLNA